MRRHITPEDKARLVLLFIKSKKSIASLCKEHRISESSYYCWRKVFVLAGTAALRRLPKRHTRKAIAMRSRQEKTAAMEMAKSNLLQCVGCASSKYRPPSKNDKNSDAKDFWINR
jgi:transposase-like protein